VNDTEPPQGTISFFNSTNWKAVLSDFCNQIDLAREILLCNHQGQLNSDFHHLTPQIAVHFRSS
jgi:hypothetical protein